MWNQYYVGCKNCFFYLMMIEFGYFFFNGLVKYDFEIGDMIDFCFGQNCFGSEVFFCLCVGVMLEDDGYLILFVIDFDFDCLECVVIDVQNVGSGLVCCIVLLYWILSGIYVIWVVCEEIVMMSFVMYF